MPPVGSELKPRITVIGVGGAGCNAVGNMIKADLEGVEFIVANTDAQSLVQSRAERRIQLGASITNGLGAGARPDIGRAAAEEAIEVVLEHLQGSHMAFITAGMGGGTGTGAGPVIARAAREQGILVVGVVTKPFHFEGQHRMTIAEEGIQEIQQFVDTLIVIPNQNLFRVANEKTSFSDAFTMADDVLYSGVRGVTDLMVMPGLINLDFADIRTVMSEMGKAMMGTGEASGERRAIESAEAAIANPLLEDVSMKGAHGLLINITGGLDMTLFEVDEAANRIRDEIDDDANIIFGSTFDETMEGVIRVSIVATGIDVGSQQLSHPSGIHIVGQPNEPVSYPETRPAVEARPAVVTQQAYAIPASTASSQEMPVAFAQQAQAVGGGVAVARAGVKHATSQSPSAMDTRLTAAPRPADRPFIAPRPVEPTASESAVHMPTSRTGDGQVPRRRGNLSLLQKMAGAAKEAVEYSQRSEAVSAEGKTESPPPAVTQPSPAPESPPTAEWIPTPTPTPAPTPAPTPTQSSFGGLDRPAQHGAEQDLLEIPAFLRRQAN